MGHYTVTGQAAVMQGDGSAPVNQTTDGVKPSGYSNVPEPCT